MAYSDKNIIITPNKGSSTLQPNITFTDGRVASSATMTVGVETVGGVASLTFDGTAGRLFTINDTFTGTIFSITDVNGIPSMEVSDTGTILLARYKGFVQISTTTNSTSTSTGGLIVTGGIGVGGNVNVGGYVSVGGNFTATGTLAFGKSFSEPAGTATISGNALTLDLSVANVFSVTINSSITTLTISNPAASGRVSSFVLVFNYTGGAYSVTWPASVRWPGGIAPTLVNTNAKRDIFTLFTTDGGTSYNAFVSGQNL